MSYNWKNILIQIDSTLEDAIKVIDSESLRIALIVDSDLRLLGTVTDGDIRRALISHLPLSSEVSAIMNYSPVTIGYEAPFSEMLSLIKRHDLMSLPLMDGETIVGLKTLQSLISSSSIENPVLLMAGGFGKRLRPLTDQCPKPLLKIGKKPILEIILEQFIQSGFTRFYISLHYMPEMIMDYFGDGLKWNVSIEYVFEEVPLGTGGALGLLPDNLVNLPVIVMNGDILTKFNPRELLDYHKAHGLLATVCVREQEYQIPYGVITAEGYRVIDMTEKPMHKYFVNAGIYVVAPEIIKTVRPNEKIDMPDLVSRPDKNYSSLAIFPMYEYWLDIGQKFDFKKAQDEVVRLFPSL